MRVKIAKWGNSLAVRIPKDVIARAGLKEGQEMEIGSDGAVVQIKPTYKRYTIEELFAEAAKNGPLEPSALVDWGPDRGSEILPDDEYSRGEITYEDIVSGRDAARRR